MSVRTQSGSKLAPRASAAPAQDRCTGHGEMIPYCAPLGLRTPRPPWLGPVLLLSFVGAALAIHLVLRQLTYDYGHLIGRLAGVHPFELPKQASIAVRPLTVALLLVLGAGAAGSLLARARLVLTTLIIYLPLMIAIDVVLARLARYGAPSPFMARGNILDGVAGILAACLAVFSAARLPANLYVKPVVKRPKYNLAVFAASIAATVGSVAGLFHFESRELHLLAAVPLLGGLLSVVVLFLSLFPVYLCAFGYVAQLLRKRSSSEDLTSVEDDKALLTFGFLVPAHNEEGRIGDCIRAIDRAAGECAAPATIYVIENGSTDATYEEARETLAECRHARGVLLTSSTEHKSRAKAHALNTGLSATTEPVVVRVDADTFVSSTLLNRLAPHFSDPQVGGVGTVPLPHKVTTWIERMRTVEVYYGAGFKRTSQGAVDAIPVLPGATVAFRRELLVRVGGFSEGILGEDSDITVRVGRLGYRIVSDPAIIVFSEQPQNLRELREQRMRWSFGLFHMIGRNRSTIFHLQGLRGIWTLPWACFVMFRKLMLIPFAVAALALVVVGHSFFPVREVAAAGAITLGAQLIGMALVVTVLAGPSRIISLPSYIVFRLIVTYFALETLFTVRLKEPSWRPPVPLALLRSRLRRPVTRAPAIGAPTSPQYQAAPAGQLAQDHVPPAGRPAPLPRRVPGANMMREPPTPIARPVLPFSFPLCGSEEAPTQPLPAILAGASGVTEEIKIQPDIAAQPEPATAAPADHTLVPARHAPAEQRPGWETGRDVGAASPEKVPAHRENAQASAGRARAHQAKALARSPKTARRQAWARRHRDITSRVILVVVLLSAGSLAFLLTRHAGTAPAANGDRAGVSAEVAIRNRAAAWVAGQVSRAATVSCDPVMCQALEAHGIPAVSLLELRAGEADPLRSSVIVATAAVRSMVASRLLTADAPVAIARFGSGSTRIDIRVIGPRGAAAYSSALSADVAARKGAGTQLLQSQRIMASATAFWQLADGQVDSRLLVTIANLAAHRPVSIVAFGDLAPGASPGIPLRSADLAAAAGMTGPKGDAQVRWMSAFLHAQRGRYMAWHINIVRLAGGRTALRIEFAAPSPLGLLAPLVPSR